MARAAGARIHALLVEPPAIPGEGETTDPQTVFGHVDGSRDSARPRVGIGQPAARPVLQVNLGIVQIRQDNEAPRGALGRFRRAQRHPGVERNDGHEPEKKPEKDPGGVAAVPSRNGGGLGETRPGVECKHDENLSITRSAGGARWRVGKDPPCMLP